MGFYSSPKGGLFSEHSGVCFGVCVTLSAFFMVLFFKIQILPVNLNDLFDTRTFALLTRQHNSIA